METYKKVPTFTDYSISDHGRIYNRITGNYRNPSINKDGYYTISIRKGGKKRTILIHRIVAKAFVENPHNKPCVNHKDGNKLNNHASNLEWCTIAENNRHAHKNGLMNIVKGEQSGTAKLTEDIVLEMRRLYLVEDITQKQIADVFGVNHCTVHYVIARKTWAHI